LDYVKNVKNEKFFIIARIYESKKIRFNELRKDGLVVKIINKSQNVEYKLSEFGNSAVPIISALKKWSFGRKKEISKIVNI
jgi:DNA-binding HxlR family transcriptional regulator